MDSQEQFENDFQKTIDQISARAEKHFITSIEHISKQYANNFTFSLEKELLLLSNRLRSENLMNLKKDIAVFINGDSHETMKLTMTQIVSDLIVGIISANLRLR